MEQLTLKNYKGVDNTLENIKAIILRNYSQDYLKPFDKWSVEKVYNYVRALPYVKDPENVPISNNDNIELLKSPKMMIFTNGGDCDDKATLIGAILHRKGIPYRMAVVSTMPDKIFHHIYPEIFIGGKWYPIDPTYPLWDKNHTPSIPFVEKPFTLKKVYDWTSGKTETMEFNGPTFSAAGNLKGSGSGTGSLSGTKLAILEGDRSCKVQLLGEPITAAATIIASVAQLFSGIFGADRYQDAYNVWEAAANALPGAVAANDYALAGINRAIVAILGVDYMNPPWGANVCTSSGRCGNRAEWKKIQQAVENKAAEVAPYFAWLSQNGNLFPAGSFGMEGLYNFYKDYKNNSGAYQQFLSAHGSKKNQNTGINIAGMGTSTLLIIGALGTAAYFILK